MQGFHVCKDLYFVLSLKLMVKLTTGFKDNSIFPPEHMTNIRLKNINYYFLTCIIFPNFIKVYTAVSGNNKKYHFIIQHHWPISIPGEAGIQSIIHSMRKRLKLPQNNLLFFLEIWAMPFHTVEPPQKFIKCGSYLL